MNQDDAAAIILEYLREAPREVAHYGYDLYIPSAIRAYLISQDRRRHEAEQEVRELSPVFYAAAWDLCRRGILRPGVRRAGEQATDDGSGGNGYSLTPLGQEYLAQEPEVTTVPLGPGRFEQMMHSFAELLGPGFQERAAEAIRCYRAGAYVACCAMAGAAAESLMLAVAIEKTDDENAVLAAYVGNIGRRRLENIIVGQAAEHVRREFTGFLVLLKYWRDQASHGVATKISDNEAYTALVTLLRFAHFARDHWEQLTE
jgi:hypothetical protein